MKNGGFYLSEKCLVSALSLFINFSNMYTVQYLKTPCKPLIQNDLYYINTCTDLPPPPPRKFQIPYIYIYIGIAPPWQSRG